METEYKGLKRGQVSRSLKGFDNPPEKLDPLKDKNNFQEEYAARSLF